MPIMYWVRCMGEGTNHTPLPAPHPPPSCCPCIPPFPHVHRMGAHTPPVSVCMLFKPPPCTCPLSLLPCTPSPPLHVCPPPFPCALLAACGEWGVVPHVP